MKMGLELILIIIAIVIVGYLFFYYAGILLAPPLPLDEGLVCIKGQCFSVELSKTAAQKERGLMFRKFLDKDKGMLFIFEKEEIHPFWMKNTLIALDIIWIASDNKIVFINKNTQPCESLICPSIIPPVKAKYVLELNAGASEEAGMKVGDSVELDI